jgi:hypothetical protein
MGAPERRCSPHLVEWLKSTARVKAMVSLSGADDGDAHGCHYPPWRGVFVEPRLCPIMVACL